MKSNSNLSLENQLCFPVYASSRLITRKYMPYLDELGITYPQYVILMVLWDHEPLNVTSLGSKVYLNSNTLTPLLKKMEQKGLVVKKRCDSDERTVEITLTENGRKLKSKAESIPFALANELNMPMEELEQMRKSMWKFLNNLNKE